MGEPIDVVEAFLEDLVEPVLVKFGVLMNRPPPTLDGHRAIAKQMHAVVLLYNYFYRKGTPNMEFLDFVSFCKLAMKIDPVYNSCMKITKQNNPTELIGEENQFSPTEKAISEACDLAVSLDPAEDIPIVEGCGISKVAVLLVDSENNCFLQYGLVIEGVWALIEKDVADLIRPQILASATGSKRKMDDLEESDENKELLKLAYDAVKEAAGIESSDLDVIETHITYSLAKEKSAVKFYIMQSSQIMQCARSFGKSDAVQLSILVKSLQGPLVKKFPKSWLATSVVNYLPIFPYARFISSWLLGKDNQKKFKHPYCENIASSVKTLQNTIPCNENRIPVIMNRWVQFDTAKYNTAGQNKLASDDIIYDALAVFYRRRQDLYSQFYCIEDALTVYEDCIERMRDGGDADLARQCITSILSGNSGLVTEHKHATTRSSATIFLGNSSCQDLGSICFKNNWRLPRYFVEPSDGRFKSKVSVTTKDMNLQSEGGLELKPYEARESAATQMIANIRKTFA